MLEALQTIGRPVFATREIAALSGASVASTTQSLGRLERRGLVTAVRRGIWCSPRDPRFSRFALVPFLAGTHPAYVSFVTALHLHGRIEQIPQVIEVATTGHPRVVATPVGSFEFHRIAPDFFAGFDWYGDRRDFLIARPEKALVDCLYLSSRRGKRFRYVTGLDLGEGFDRRAAWIWVDRIRDRRIRVHVGRALGARIGERRG
jgi:predicted transcriptional regulator of viral defense system